MRIAIATPAAAGTKVGNRVTAERWRRLLRELDHRVDFLGVAGSNDADLLIALHARKSHDEIARFRMDHPERPIVVVLAGTDLSVDLSSGGRRRETVLGSMAAADRIVVLHPLASPDVPSEFRDRVRVVLQSARPLAHPPERSVRHLDLAVVGHLRAIKDPFLPADAARRLPARSRVRIVHYGRALDPSMLAGARAAMEKDHRYVWRGERTRGEVRQAIARAHALVHPSIAEGGANTVSESLVLGTPVLASAIPGNLGLLGVDYPGVFPVGDAASLAELIGRFEAEATFRAVLRERCEALAERHAPERERDAWAAVLAECTSSS